MSLFCIPIDDRSLKRTSDINIKIFFYPYYCIFGQIRVDFSEKIYELTTSSLFTKSFSSLNTGRSNLTGSATNFTFFI